MATYSSIKIYLNKCSEQPECLTCFANEADITILLADICKLEEEQKRLKADHKTEIEQEKAKYDELVKEFEAFKNNTNIQLTSLRNRNVELSKKVSYSAPKQTREVSTITDGTNIGKTLFTYRPKPTENFALHLNEQFQYGYFTCRRADVYTMFQKLIPGSVTLLTLTFVIEHNKTEVFSVPLYEPNARTYKIIIETQEESRAYQKRGIFPVKFNIKGILNKKLKIPILLSEEIPQHPSFDAKENFILLADKRRNTPLHKLIFKIITKFNLREYVPIIKAVRTSQHIRSTDPP